MKKQKEMELLKKYMIINTPITQKEKNYGDNKICK